MVLKMVDKKTIGINSVISLGIVMLAMITPGFFDEPKYYCEIESKVLECPGGISGGSQTRCYDDVNHTGWDYCSTGWLEVVDNRVMQKETSTVEKEYVFIRIEPDTIVDSLTLLKSVKKLEEVSPSKEYKCNNNNCCNYKANYTRCINIKTNLIEIKS